MQFAIDHRDTTTRARVGRVSTPHGTFDTPAFMPVGTQAAIKGLLPWQVEGIGAQIMLANTYHLLLRPGPELVEQMGGLQQWMNWRRPVLTDSGGFQVFSLADINKIGEDGVTFRSHLNGQLIELTPERSMQVQHGLGADIIMAFDDCPPAVQQPGEVLTNDPLAARRHAVAPADYLDRVKLANERTLRWLDRCVQTHKASGCDARQGLFGIVQGGIDLDQRTWCAERVTQFDLPGYAIGGVAVGEGSALIREVVEHTAPLLPEHKPRYLMGVGYERDIIAAVRAGVDMFDCVLPTRNGRNANAFTRAGQVRLRNAKFKDDPRPLEEGCDCPACAGSFRVSSSEFRVGEGATDGRGASPLTRNSKPETRNHFSRSYLRHLFQAGEMLGPILVSLHNLRHFQRLMLDIRQAIRQNDWSLIARAWPHALESRP
ncbi:tRNA guanosine(34) transglycosylase Tgt [Natronomicrosphaera hydrolytica]|uniref:tRNA guanosine(34) transglycosylase Tgt n=1 Tax=Natronomicrosphaera hydrolytica TaxID=3242702 RepID=UPI003CC91D55